MKCMKTATVFQVKRDWCATEVNPKKKTVRKWAYCLKPGEKNPIRSRSASCSKGKTKTS